MKQPRYSYHTRVPLFNKGPQDNNTRAKPNLVQQPRQKIKQNKKTQKKRQSNRVQQSKLTTDVKATQTKLLYTAGEFKLLLRSASNTSTLFAQEYMQFFLCASLCFSYVFQLVCILHSYGFFILFCLLLLRVYSSSTNMFTYTVLYFACVCVCVCLPGAVVIIF